MVQSGLKWFNVHQGGDKTVFRGRTEQVIDPKGRVILPVKFREILSSRYDNNLMITNFDGCLLCYPMQEWSIVEDKIRKLPTGTPHMRSFKRFFMSGASECPVDRQGRVLVPQSLKHYAQLERDIVVAGQIDHFEIWSTERFYENIKLGQEVQETEEISAFINDLGL